MRARRPLRSPRSAVPLRRTGRPGDPVAGADPLAPWISAQVLNLRRHAAALGPFRRAEFEAGRATVSEGHVQATNALISSLRRELLAMSDQVARAARDAQASRSTPELQRMLVLKERAEELPPLRPVAYAPADTLCNELLFRMLRARLHLAVVHDESSRTLGGGQLSGGLWPVCCQWHSVQP